MEHKANIRPSNKELNVTKQVFLSNAISDIARPSQYIMDNHVLNVHIS